MLDVVDQIFGRIIGNNEIRIKKNRCSRRIIVAECNEYIIGH